MLKRLMHALEQDLQARAERHVDRDIGINRLQTASSKDSGGESGETDDSNLSSGPLGNGKAEK